jgi:inner membrane protein
LGNGVGLMPTVMTHALVPLAAGLMLGRAQVPPRIIVAGMILAMVPDADVIGFRLGIEYGDPWGHRGASHSFFAAAVVGGVVAFALRPTRLAVAALFLFGSMASHGLLDTLTNGGLGAALLWPFSDTRFHAAVTPIAVSPIGISGFLTERGLLVLASEARWVWLPCLAGVVISILIRRIISPKAKGSS